MAMADDMRIIVKLQEKQSEVTYEKGICKQQHTAQDWLTS